MRVLSEKEIQEFLQILEWYKKAVSQDKKLARRLLTDIGILTKKGTIRKEYINVCIALDRASS